jgi:hypothetical protein
VKHFSRTATLGALAALLLLPLAAQAEIAPVPRPTTPTTGVSPVVKPTVQPVHAPVQVTPTAQTTVQETPAQHTTVQTSTPSTQVVVHASPPALSSGGRAQVPIPVATSGGHADDETSSAAVATPHAVPPPPAPALVPTKLVAVGHDPVPSYDAWPSWVLTVLTVLISAEAFLVVRLSRSRGRSRVAQGISV